MVALAMACAWYVSTYSGSKIMGPFVNLYDCDNYARAIRQRDRVQVFCRNFADEDEKKD
jgi:hypothetical protein